MKFVIIDWCSNICFDSDNVELPTFEDGWQFLEDQLSTMYGEDYEDQDLSEYYVEEYNPELDRIMYRGNRLALHKDYYKGV